MFQNGLHKVFTKNAEENEGIIIYDSCLGTERWTPTIFLITYISRMILIFWASYPFVGSNYLLEYWNYSTIQSVGRPSFRTNRKKPISFEFQLYNESVAQNRKATRKKFKRAVNSPSNPFAYPFLTRHKLFSNPKNNADIMSGPTWIKNAVPPPALRNPPPLKGKTIQQ